MQLKNRVSLTIELSKLFIFGHPVVVRVFFPFFHSFVPSAASRPASPETSSPRGTRCRTACSSGCTHRGEYNVGQPAAPAALEAGDTAPDRPPLQLATGLVQTPPRPRRQACLSGMATSIASYSPPLMLPPPQLLPRPSRPCSVPACKCPFKTPYHQSSQPARGSGVLAQACHSLLTLANDSFQASTIVQKLSIRRNKC